MTDQDTSLASEQAKALIMAIEARRDEDCQAQLKEAQAEADRIIAAARKRAHQKFREAARMLRRDSARRVAEAEAERDTGLRMCRQRARLELVRETWPRLTEALAERWRDGAARSRWIRAALVTATMRLGSGSWRIEHPAADGKDIRQALAEMRDALADIHCTSVASDTIGAGLRLHAGGAVVDATPEALLALRSRVEAALIGEIERLTLEREHMNGETPEAAHG